MPTAKKQGRLLLFSRLSYIFGTVLAQGVI